MKVIFGYRNIPKYRKPMVALGIFDGMHQAHIRILKDLVAQSRRLRGTSMVVTFFPHPRKKESLYSLEHRLRLINQLGIDICIVIRFNQKFSRISAEDFVKNILVRKIKADYIYVGRNFRFGKKAKGDIGTLKQLSRSYNFGLKIFEVMKKQNKPISSTYIRKMITGGELGMAQALLSRPVTVLGTVIRGASLGSQFGFPTANINPHHEILPPDGVYAVRIIFNNQELKGICYLGTKPTFRKRKEDVRGKQERHIEVYIFNFKRNIYGEYLEIEFVKKIRDEKKFVSPQALVEQIKKDILAAQKIFSLHNSLPQHMPIQSHPIH